jgi:hypothetical protein
MGGSAMAGQPGFFDGEERLKALSAAGDPLERLAQIIDFEVFRGELESALSRSDRSKGGRPPYDAVLMFKVLVLQTLYALSDEQTEYQLKDRLSFMRFVGLALRDAVPDAKTIWLYREQLARAGAAEQLFARFDALLRAKGWLAMGGQIVDAMVIGARRPRLTQPRRTRCEAAAHRPIGRRRGAPRSTATGDGPSSVTGSARRHQPKDPLAKSRSRCQCSATRTMSASTASTVLCGATPPTQRRMMAANSARCSTATTPPAMCGPTAPTARRRI